MKKRNVMKMIAVVLLSATMCTTSVPYYNSNVVNAYAEETEGRFSYTVCDDGTIEINEYTGDDSEVEKHLSCLGCPRQDRCLI